MNFEKAYRHVANNAINTGHKFPAIDNMTLIKHAPYEGKIISIWEILHIYKEKAGNNLISEVLQNKNQNAIQYLKNSKQKTRHIQNKKTFNRHSWQHCKGQSK